MTKFIRVLAHTILFSVVTSNTLSLRVDQATAISRAKCEPEIVCYINAEGEFICIPCGDALLGT